MTISFCFRFSSCGVAQCQGRVCESHMQEDRLYAGKSNDVLFCESTRVCVVILVENSVG